MLSAPNSESVFSPSAAEVGSREMIGFSEIRLSTTVGLVRSKIAPLFLK